MNKVMKELFKIVVNLFAIIEFYLILKLIFLSSVTTQLVPKMLY